MNEKTGEIRVLEENEQPKAEEKPIQKLPDPNCLTCKGVGNVGINPRTQKYLECHCTHKGYKDRKIKR